MGVQFSFEFGRKRVSKIFSEFILFKNGGKTAAFKRVEF